MAFDFSNQGQSLQIVFIEYPTQKDQELNVILSGTVTFNPNFEIGDEISLQILTDGNDFVAASADPEKLVTHKVVMKQWAFTELNGVIISVLTVMVQPVVKKSSAGPMPAVFSSGGGRRDNRF